MSRAVRALVLSLACILPIATAKSGPPTDAKATIVRIEGEPIEGSFVKADLKEFQILTQSPMPGYKGKLTSAEVADLVAYLLTLKGA